MRTLVVSNLYPPFLKSGHETACQAIVESLKTRQHKIAVLTSTHGIDGTQVDNNIHRMLQISSKESLDWNDVLLKELTNQTVFKKICLDFKPEISLFFDLSHISVSLISLAEEIGLPTCTYYENKWFVTQEKDHWYQLWPDGEQGFKILRILTHRFNLLPPRKPLPITLSVFANTYLKKIAIQLKKSTSGPISKS